MVSKCRSFSVISVLQLWTENQPLTHTHNVFFLQQNGYFSLMCWFPARDIFSKHLKSPLSPYCFFFIIALLPFFQVPAHDWIWLLLPKIKDNKMVNDEAGLFMLECQRWFDWRDMCSASDRPVKMNRFLNFKLDNVGCPVPKISRSM